MPYSYIPEGCIIFGPQSARIFIFSDCFLTILHAIYLVSNKVALNQAKITVFLHLSYICTIIYVHAFHYHQHLNFSTLFGLEDEKNPVAGDHVTTVTRPQKVNVAALRSPDSVATNTTSGGYRRARSPQRSQSRGGRARSAARQQGGSSEPHVGRMAAGDTVAIGTFTARKSATEGPARRR